ncbi:lytic transglycosylase domain-containing protein [Pedobacter montanisoli]|uniref:Transglycosylase SLT domain-containing protein n=1 Tax=Pedobacter montanisoli TaxID=2923277 RepID=A0ABS9ZU53_9SPHI|nr:lytic transglycosylase domain-containing protein [Pedobacter montanisoli]MCJ0741459.1 transglycosylase SLT domain-containing protein [Pedobacter montanisoli]
MKKTLLTIFIICSSLSVFSQFKVKQLSADSLNQEKHTDTTAVPELGQALLTYNQNYIYKLRLDSIQQTVPLTYNEFVQGYIDVYSKRKDMYGKMLGLSNYYFPIFEQALKAYNIPSEIKYLPIIESSMNPHAISRVGATGLWQFMFGTAKGYGLNMDNFVDERKDPVQASYAAAAYFRDAYNELGDWLLAIAAYNCGKGNVTRAIDKAGSNDFWQIRPYLPKETRDYVPAFIAAVYVMKYASRHEITAQKSSFGFKTDSIMVTKFVALSDLAKAINYDSTTLVALNPSYKKFIVNGTLEAPKRVIIPKVDHTFYANIFEIVNADLDIDKTLVAATTDDVRDLRKLKKTSIKDQKTNTQTHSVKAGETLTAIANKYGIEVQDIKVWNKLSEASIIPGQKLIVAKNTDSLKNSKDITANKSTIYKVEAGDTLFAIAEKFKGVTVEAIQKLNGLKNNAIKVGMLLKIM